MLETEETSTKTAVRSSIYADMSLTLQHGSSTFCWGRRFPENDQPDAAYGRARCADHGSSGSTAQKHRQAGAEAERSPGYQQFINLSARRLENIASPLRVAGVSRARSTASVREAAALLKLTPISTDNAQPVGTAAAAHRAGPSYRQG